MTLFEGNLPQNDTERERQREKKKARERASWMPNAMVTAGIGFARSVNVRNSICLVYTKFNGLSCVVLGYRFWGGLSLHSVSCTSLTKNPAILK